MAIPAARQPSYAPVPRQNPLRGRLKVAIWFFSALYAVLIAWLVYLQAVRGQFFRAQGVDLRTVTSTVPAVRGDMLDSTGLPVAVTSVKASLLLDRTALTTWLNQPAKHGGTVPDSNEKEFRLVGAATSIAQASGLEFALVLPALSSSVGEKGTVALALGLDTGMVDRLTASGDRATIASRLSNAIISTDPIRMQRTVEDLTRVLGALFEGEYKEAASLARDCADLPPCVRVENRPMRVYPAGTDMAQVVGSAPFEDGRIKGRGGLERALEKDLSGSVGKMREERTAVGKPIPNTRAVLTPVNHGRTAQLTLDRGVQNIAMRALATCIEKHTPVGATAVVLDVTDGAVLAMASMPTYVPGETDTVTAKPEKPMLPKEITTSGAQTASKGLPALANRGILRYEPGSTLKALTMLAALQEGVVTPEDRFYCGGSLTDKRLGKTIHCVLHGASEKNGHGSQTMREILRNSCNVATAQIALRLRSEKLYRYIRAAGLVDERLTGLPMEERGTLAKRGGMDDTSSSTVARVGFGQSIEVTPVAMAALYSAIANDGVWHRPYLVKNWLSPDGATLATKRKTEGVRLASSANAEKMREFLKYVTDGNGLKAIRVPGYTIAGKTGTAQKFVRGGRGYAKDKRIASFIGMVPAVKPRVVVCVVVDEPNNGRYGAEVAAPVFHDIAAELMTHWRVAPDALETLKTVPTAAR